MNWKQCEPGHFYAVGIGPGAPDMVTLRAVNLIRTADVIVAPKSEKSEESLALNTVREWLGHQQLLEHVYPMTRDEASTMASWDGVAAAVATHCRAGRAVVQITLGDPLIYSTSCYLLAGLRTRLPAEQLHVVPGISAFQAVGAFFGEALTIQEDRLMLMTATDLTAVAAALDHCETLVLYKAGRQIGALRRLLEQRGLTGAARVVFYAEQGGRQTVWHDLKDAEATEPGYMATAVVHIDRKRWHNDR